jgi:hypothetical protein
MRVERPFARRPHGFRRERDVLLSPATRVLDEDLAHRVPADPQRSSDRPSSLTFLRAIDHLERDLVMRDPTSHKTPSP